MVWPFQRFTETCAIFGAVRVNLSPDLTSDYGWQIPDKPTSAAHGDSRFRSPMRGLPVFPTPLRWRPQDCHFYGPCSTSLHMHPDYALQTHANGPRRPQEPRGGHVANSQPRRDNRTPRLHSAMARPSNQRLIYAIQTLQSWLKRNLQPFRKQRNPRLNSPTTSRKRMNSQHRPLHPPRPPNPALYKQTSCLSPRPQNPRR
jgi:hypothetical protein